MSVEESRTMSYQAGDKVMEVSSASRMREVSEDKEMFSSENTETRQTQQSQAEDGTTRILTEARKEAREEFVSESHETKHYEEAETVRGEDTIQITESNFQSEKFEHQGFEEHHVKTIQSTVDMQSETGPDQASTSDDDN